MPACHWSKRKLWERNTRLWGGFIIKTPRGQKIFYSGDTAYCEIFKELGELFGPFDLAILPIGAYEPNWMMFAAHTTPEEAVRIHLDLRSRKSVAVHWGTFPLGFEHWYQPKKDLAKAKLKYGLKEEEFITMPHGS